jgi:hypothetical protein
MTSTDRVRALRERRAAKGLMRVEVFILPQEKQHLVDFMRYLEGKRLEKNYPGCGTGKVGRGR